MIKICFIHRSIRDLASFLRYAHLEETMADQLKWDNRQPDILIASEWIYYKSDCFKEFSRLYDHSGLKVAYWGEALGPDFNLFDYCIGFNNNSEAGDRMIRLLSPFDMFSGFVSKKANDILSPEEGKRELMRKTGFCNFLYSNPHAHPMRDKLYHEISQYKRVDSLGKHLNNVAVPGTGYSGHAQECISIKSPYKFSIAAENACFPGYTTEKILTSLEAHTIPVYFGNPDIAEDINPACFIHYDALSGFEELREKIRQIDEDDQLWSEIISQPWLTPTQAVAHAERTRQYHERMNELLCGQLPERLAQGYHLDLYRQHFFSHRFPFDKWYTPLKNCLKP